MGYSPSSSRGDGATSAQLDLARSIYWPSGAVAGNLSYATDGVGLFSANVEQRVTWARVPVRAGTLISSIQFYSSSAFTTPSHQLAGLYDDENGTFSGVAKARLASSADLTTDAWAANQPKRFTLQTPYSVPVDGGILAALLTDGAAVPSLAAGSPANATGAVYSQTPYGHGVADAGVTALPATLGVLSTTDSYLAPYVHLF